MYYYNHVNVTDIIMFKTKIVSIDSEKVLLKNLKMFY